MEIENLHIIQIKMFRKGYGSQGGNEGILKIHPVIAETGQEAIDKLKECY